MRQQILHCGWIILATGLIYLANLGVAGLWDEDEPIYATCAREMLQRDDWVVPYFNGQMFPDKPPLMFWMMIAGFKLFGVNELGARFWSAICGIAAALATYHLGGRLLGARVGFWAGLITGSTLIYTVSARAATVDAALTILTILAILAFVRSGVSGIDNPGRLVEKGRNVSRPSIPHRPMAWPWALMFWATLALAVLAKGPIGLLLPASAVGLFLMIANFWARRDSSPASAPGKAWARRLFGWFGWLSPPNFWRALRQMRPLTGLAVVLLVAAPWYVWVGVRTEGAWLREFFAQFNLRPFTQAIQGHKGPFWYYLPAIAIGFFPWSVYLGPTIGQTIRGIRQGSPTRCAYLLLACWVGVWLVFWSICRTKLPHYVLPAYPALGLITASALEGWLAGTVPIRRGYLRMAMGLAIAVGAGMVVGVPIAARVYVPGEEFLGAVGVILVVGGGLGWYWLEQGRRRAMLVVYATMAVLFLTAIFGVGSVCVDRHQNARPLMAEVRAQSPGKPEIAGFRFRQESVVFYAGEPIAFCDQTDQLGRFLQGARHPYVFTHDFELDEIERAFPGQWTVVARRPRFLRPGEVLVLGPRAGSSKVLNAGRMTRQPR